MEKDTLENYEYVKQRINQEGFHYCFVHYSDFTEEITDLEFHQKRLSYLKATKDLTEYINDKINQLRNE